MVSGEDETRKLLRIREDLDDRIRRLEVEIGDLKQAISEIDKSIVRQGFRHPLPPKVGVKPVVEEDGDGGKSVKSKDGTTLGHLQIEEDMIAFNPVESLAFTVSIPPFQSFFLERVLGNMKATDEGKAAGGEIPPGEVLSFEVATDGERIVSIDIRNYGGERRLREIQSSLRWAFDKMYEKLTQA
ncbi:hypothetical protein ISS39_05225 [Candidatus Bathyarchaeota archaeon]|nr:hypothetical protein [Candidatus Bathyarchaeota archaeon]